MKLTWASLVTATAFALFAGPLPQGPGTAALSSAPQIAVDWSAEISDGSPFGETGKVQSVTPAQAGEFHVSGDGTRFLALRFRAAGSVALRLHIAGMRLAEGASLFVYGIRNGSVTEVAGPYTGTGPSFDNDFWTDAVSGDEVVLEFQPGSSEPADLPFTVVEAARAEAADVAVAPEAGIETRTSMFRGKAVRHEVIDGIAVFERDIILGPADELEPANSKAAAHTRESLGITGSRYRWPGGVIPYTIDPLMPNQTRVTNAISHWNTKLAGTIQFVPRTTQFNYVHFAKAASASTCSSSIGMMGYGRQNVNVGDYCSTGNVIHEAGHAVGLWHEQGREDRNTFVKILWENITSTATHNFNQNITNGDDLGAYDYGSIMHYPAYGFSSNGKPTIETIPAGIPIGQRSSLSTGDIAGVKLMYGTASTTTAPPAVTTSDVTISTNPSGLPVTVDGQNYTAPATFKWTPGSTHTIAAGVPAATTTRYTFQKWSDGGAQTHSVTTPSTAATFKADYAVAYAVLAAATPTGTVSVSPTSADAFYPANTMLNLAAAAPTGYCFAGWAGLLSSTPASTSLIVSKSYSLTANFLTGSVTPAQTVLLVPGDASTISLGINASTGCRWTLQIQTSWVSASAVSGTGPAVVTLNIQKNTSGLGRRTTLRVNGVAVQLTQSAK